MTTVTAHSAFGSLLRDWRQRRRLSQLDLAVDAEVSARHLSFVETGRAKPSRALVLHLAEQLEVPLRERNSLLLAAGYAPVYSQASLERDEMAPVRDALEKILAGHEPFPAVVVNRHWNLVSANAPALALLTEGVAPHLLEPPVNALRVTLHPEGLGPRIVNFAEYSEHLVSRLHREATVTGDPKLVELEAELRGFPGVAAAPAGHPSPASLLFVPLVLRRGDHELTFFSTVATFGTARDVTIAELSIESFFPADAKTAESLRQSAIGNRQ